MEARMGAMVVVCGVKRVEGRRIVVNVRSARRPAFITAHVASWSPAASTSGGS